MYFKQSFGEIATVIKYILTFQYIFGIAWLDLSCSFYFFYQFLCHVERTLNVRFTFTIKKTASCADSAAPSGCVFLTTYSAPEVMISTKWLTIPENERSHVGRSGEPLWVDRSGPTSDGTVTFLCLKFSIYRCLSSLTDPQYYFTIK